MVSKSVRISVDGVGGPALEVWNHDGGRALELGWNHDGVAEPSGIAALAAVLFGKVKPKGRTIVVLSGGNVDAATLAAVLTRGTS